MSLPVKLAVCFLIIGLMTPAVADMADDAGRSVREHGLERQADVLRDAISRVYYAGEGNVTTVSLSIPAGMSLEVGGEGAEMFAVRLLVDGEQTGVVYLDSPAVPVLSGRLSISGECSVSVGATERDGAYGVLVWT